MVKIISLLFLIFLTSCGGGGSVDSSNGSSLQSNNESIKINGVIYYTNFIINSNIRVKCSDGTTHETKSNLLGYYEVNIKKTSLPCAISSTGGTLNNSQNNKNLYSFTITNDNFNLKNIYNINILTTFIIEMIKKKDLEAWFLSNEFSGLNRQSVNSTLISIDKKLNLLNLFIDNDPLSQFINDGKDNYASSIKGILSVFTSSLTNITQLENQLISNAEPTAFDNNLFLLNWFKSIDSCSYTSKIKSATSVKVTSYSNDITSFERIFPLQLDDSYGWNQVNLVANELAIKIGGNVLQLCQNSCFGFSSSSNSNPASKLIIRKNGEDIRFSIQTSRYAYSSSCI